MSTDQRNAGIALAAASILSVVAMAHHPSGPGGHGGLNQAVHGAMIVIVLVSLGGYTRFAMRLGVARFDVLLGLIAYAASALANVLAATINGFVAPAAFEHSVSPDVLRLAWEFNQALAYGAVYGTGAALLLWSFALLRRAGFERFLGVSALIVGGVTIGLLAGDLVQMNVAGAFIVYALQAAMGVLVGASLMRSRDS